MTALLLATPATAQDRAVVEASAPQSLAVTVYRDPARGSGEEMNRDWPQGFAMISETRTVILPPGRTTIRFDGVAEGMVAVSAIVTGLPGGTIEKNRNADLLSPAALVDGMLGNRVTITRTNPATGEGEAESAVVRTRADGGLVLQTADGYEAVRCSGLPERLSFAGVPQGLSANPVFTIDTADAAGGAYTVTLTYLAWGFDWEASYVATIHEGRDADDLRFDLTSWLTILNDNGQTFPGAELMAVAGTLNVVSDFEELADPPQAAPLRLTCYPLGSTAAGSPIYYPAPPPPPPPMFAVADSDTIMVTARRRMEGALMESAAPILAVEEALGDLKLYRIPLPVEVPPHGRKPGACRREENGDGARIYTASCSGWDWNVRDPVAAGMRLETVNDAEHGLGVALPSGQVSVFERGTLGDMLVAEAALRDYASGQDVDIHLAASAQVFSTCRAVGNADPRAGKRGWAPMEATISNANPFPVSVRLYLGSPAQWSFRGVAEAMAEGQRIPEVRVPANAARSIGWQVRPVDD